RSFFTKRMFGGLAVYYEHRMVALLMESPGERSYRGKKYKFDLWNGILWPTFREHQPSLLSEFPVISHPVLGKWVYLPGSHPEFESTAMKIIEQIRKQDLRLGIEPKFKR